MRQNQETHWYLGDTTSLCEVCLTLVPAKIISEDNSVFFLKQCIQHGLQKTLISTDLEYYRWCSNFIEPTVLPHSFQTKFEKGCPFDCGLCHEHEQHSCMAILEIIDDCNMHCPTCIAGSFPGAGNAKTLNEIEMMLDTVVESEGYPDLLMISGGEPTIHPQFFEVLKRVKQRPIKHVMLITNGKLIAEDDSFVGKLAEFKDNFEVYLQFDSLRPEVLLNIRGEDVRDMRLRALHNLESAGISTTLICVVKKGLNDDELGQIIEFALGYSCVRGVTFQPVKVTGRNETFDKEVHYITLSETRARILEGFPRFQREDMRPHPCNPENICIGYLVREKDGRVTPVTELLLEGQSGSSMNASVEFPGAAKLKTMLYFQPGLDTPFYNYKNLFRITIVSFLDKFNFSITSARRSCIHFVTASKQIIPLDTYYLFYADRQISLPLTVLKGRGEKK